MSSIEENSTLYEEVMEQNIFEELELTLGREFDNYKLYTDNENGEYSDSDNYNDNDDSDNDNEEFYKTTLLNIEIFNIYGIDIKFINICFDKRDKKSKYAIISLDIKKSDGEKEDYFTTTITNVNLKKEYLNYKNIIEKNLKMLLNLINYNEIDECFSITKLSTKKIEKIKNIINDNEEYKCSVCYNPTLFKTHCGHTLCNSCRNKICENRIKPCPICRKNYAYIHLIKTIKLN